MPTFTTARDAKEFLVNRIVAEAHSESIALSEIEQKMLYFSETHWAPPDIWETNEAFDRDYNSSEYEEKIALLIQNLAARDRKENPAEYATWKKAVRTLDREDHYLLVLIGIADGSLSTGDSSPINFFKILKISLSISAVLIVIALICRWLLG